MINKANVPFIYVIICFLFLSACATTTTVKNEHKAEFIEVDSKTSPQLNNANPEGWWYISFNIAWPESSDVAWNVDAFLAHKIIKPKLDAVRDNFKAWRFHRRANRDATGHRFSFIFYTDAGLADQLLTQLLNDNDLQVIESVGVLRKIDFSDTSINVQPNIEDTSDKAWSVAVQKSWPLYITGASEMWLALIDEFVQQDKQKVQFDNYQDWLNYYSQIESKVGNVWKIEGNHAFLHHLNALFAYRETIIIEQKLKRF